MRSGDGWSQAAKLFCDMAALIWAKRADRAQQVCGFGNDVVGCSRADFCDGDNGGIKDRNRSRYHRLNGGHDGTGNGNRIDGIVRHRRMSACTIHCDGQYIGRSQQRPRPTGENAMRRIGHDVQRKGRIG